MVIGSGMIAKAFSHYITNDNVVIFASGVSDSKNTKDEVFEREMDLLKSIDTAGKKLVYFSTVSVYDETLSSSAYVLHKLRIEYYIHNNISDYMIFRLPNIIGETSNLHTFFNFFKNKIINNEELAIQQKAYRYIMDISDVSRYLTYIINSGFSNRIINVCFNEKFSIFDLVAGFEKVLNIQAKKKIIGGGCNYDVDNSEFMSLIDSVHEADSNYINNTLQKYLKNDKHNICKR